MFVVAIDGPAGSGKGTVAKIVSKKIGALNIDTGAMFRCVALEMVNKNIKIEELDKIQEILDNIKIELKQDNGKIKVFLNKEDVSEKIRTEEISKFVSPISTINIVREKLLILQREMALTQDVVMEGRDIGTIVFPNADVKIYLDAKPEERAKRRTLQNRENGLTVDFDEVLKEIKIRDNRDINREIAPLKKAEDAFYLDSTNLSVKEVVNQVLEIINEKKNNI